MKKSAEAQKFQTRNIIFISLSHLLHDTYGAFLAPLLPLLIEKLGFSYAMAGFLPSARQLPSLLNPWLGVLADKIRIRYFLIFAPAVTAISMSLLGVAPSYAMLVVLLAIGGLSAACYHVPAPVMIRRIAGEQVGKGMSFFMFGGELARTLSPLVIVGALSLWGLEGTYKLILPGVLASFFLYITLKDITIQQNIVFGTQPTTGLLQTLRDLLPLFLALTGMVFFMAGMKGALVAFLPSFLTERGYSISQAGVALSVLQGGGVVGVLTAGILSDKFGRKILLLIVALVAPILVWVFLLIPGILMLPLLGILGFFLFATGPMILTVVQESNSARPAYVNGIYMMINFVISSIMTVMIGILSDWVGFENTYRFSTGWYLGSIPCILLLPGKTHVPAFIARRMPPL